MAERIAEEIAAVARTAAGERWELKIGAPVEAADGALGRLGRVVVRPADERVTALLVQDDLVPGAERCVPIEAVASAREDRILLRWSAEEARQAVCDARAFHAPTRAVAGYAPGEALYALYGGPRGVPGAEGAARHFPEGAMHPLRAGLRVQALDGAAGRVHELLVDPSGAVTHLVFDPGWRGGPVYLVPADWIRAVTAEEVVLGAMRADLERLPQYRPDDELAEEIRRAWERDTTLAAMWAHSWLDAEVRDGVAVLKGYAWTEANRRQLEELARAVPGVLDVRNEVVTDEALPLRVMAAIEHDPRTHGARVQVDSVLGEVRLEGEAPDVATWCAVSEAAASVPRVRRVSNQVRVPGAVLPPEPGVLAQPRVGQRVLTHDGPFGTVDRVILSARNRRVTALRVAGELPVPEAARRPEEWPRRPRVVVLPARWIEGLTAAEVMLHVGYRQAASAPEWRPERYAEAGPSWLPPYPYEAAEILLDVGPAVATASREAHRTASEPSGEGEAGAPIRPGQPVRCPFGPVGRVERVLRDPTTGEPSALEIRAGEGLPVEVTVPMAWVRAVDAHGVLLDATYDELLERAGARRTPAAA